MATGIVAASSRIILRMPACKNGLDLTTRAIFVTASQKLTKLSKRPSKYSFSSALLLPISLKLL